MQRQVPGIKLRTKGPGNRPPREGKTQQVKQALEHNVDPRHRHLLNSRRRLAAAVDAVAVVELDVVLKPRHSCRCSLWNCADEPYGHAIFHSVGDINSRSLRRDCVREVFYVSNTTRVKIRTHTHTHTRSLALVSRPQCRKRAGMHHVKDCNARPLHTLEMVGAHVDHSHPLWRCLGERERERVRERVCEAVGSLACYCVQAL